VDCDQETALAYAAEIPAAEGGTIEVRLVDADRRDPGVRDRKRLQRPTRGRPRASSSSAASRKPLSDLG
jgi:hypothetical protein